ncbi:MAG: LemA family protein, partial [Planctomycetota bacterium]|nr:LemA family protein [Planctomycetota bacterium]
NQILVNGFISMQYPVMLALTGTVIIIIIVVAVIVILLLWALAVYNGLVRKRQSCKESWSDIDTELKRRHDLIPNLVNTVKGYAAHESGVMEEVTKLRNEAVQVQDKGPEARSKVEGQLGASVDKLIARAEAYPDLKASANFLELQKELSETETRIARSRRFYNSNVREFHNGCQVIPASIIASIGGFKEIEFDFFQVDDVSERDPVDVKFGDDQS